MSRRTITEYLFCVGFMLLIFAAVGAAAWIVATIINAVAS